jgi:transposase
MSSFGRRYPAELRRQMVELVRTGRTAEELSQEFEPSAASIRTAAPFDRRPQTR